MATHSLRPKAPNLDGAKEAAREREVPELRDIADEACCIAFHDDLPLSSSEHSARHIEMRGVFTNMEFPRPRPS